MNLQNRKHRFVPRRETRLYLAPGGAARAAGVLSVWEQSAAGIWAQYDKRAVATVECEDPAVDLAQVAGHVTVDVFHRIYERGGTELSGTTAVVREAPPHLQNLVGVRITMRFAENASAQQVQRPRIFRVIRGGIKVPKIPRHYWWAR